MSGSSSTSEFGGYLATAGAAFALTGLLEATGALAGLGMVIVGAFLAAPGAGSAGGTVDQWWKALCGAGLIAFCGLALSYAVPALGGLLLGVGCIGVVTAGLLGTATRARTDPARG